MTKNRISNQYGGIQDASIVSAVYVPNELYKNNPLIEALPSDLMEPVSLNRFLAVDKSFKADKSLPKSIRKSRLKLIQEFRFPLAFYLEVHEQLVSILYESYSSTTLCDSINLHVIIRNEIYEIISNGLPEIGWTAPGFTLLGHSGSGKSICIQAVLSQLPPVILHTLEDGTRIPQVTYLYAPCLHTGGLKAVCSKLAEDLDAKLQNGNIYTQAVNRKRTIEQMTLYMAQLLRLFNVGVVILDEVQNLLSEHSTKTLNTLTYLFNCTHTGIVLVGTEEAYDALTGKEFLQRRLGESVRADSYCQDYKTISRILDALFKYYMFTSTRTEPQDWSEYEEIKQFIFNFTGGIIYRITGIFCTLQKMLINEEDRQSGKVINELTLRDIKVAAMEHARKNQWEKIPEICRLMKHIDNDPPAENVKKLRNSGTAEIKDSQYSESGTPAPEDLQATILQKYRSSYTDEQIYHIVSKVEKEMDISSIKLADLWRMMDQALKKEYPEETKHSKPSSEEMKKFLMNEQRSG